MHTHTHKHTHTHTHTHTHAQTLTHTFIYIDVFLYTMTDNNRYEHVNITDNDAMQTLLLPFRGFVMPGCSFNFSSGEVVFIHACADVFVCLNTSVYMNVNY